MGTAAVAGRAYRQVDRSAAVLRDRSPRPAESHGRNQARRMRGRAQQRPRVGDLSACQYRTRRRLDRASARADGSVAQSAAIAVRADDLVGYARSSYNAEKGSSIGRRRNWVKPASRAISRAFSSPMHAPIPAPPPPSDTLMQYSVDIEYIRRPIGFMLSSTREETLTSSIR